MIKINPSINNQDSKSIYLTQYLYNHTLINFKCMLSVLYNKTTMIKINP